MEETKQSSKDIIEDMLSRDAHKILHGCYAICALSQNHDRIMELIPYKEEMYNATRNIDLGGLIVRNQPFLEKAFEVMELHEKGEECSCSLLGEDFNPKRVLDDGYFELLDDVVRHGEGCFGNHYMIVQCNRCKKRYKVEENFYHYVWWDWQLLEE